MLRNDFTFSKRQLGILCLILGIIAFVAILGVDILDAGREGGIGPAQRIALGLSVVLAVLGLSLIPAGNDPA